MAVPCQTCGRTYDVTLFQFGRTLQCACGTRVGMEPRVSPPSGRPRLFADAMLGRLARWLRILGHDTAYDPDIHDAKVARRCLTEGRVLLTRDRRLPEEWRLPRVLLVRSERPLEQLREVIERLGLDRSGPLFRRCTLCNTVVEPVGRDEVRTSVPGRVWRDQDRFVRCPTCGRTYWEGSHTRRMRERLAGVWEGIAPEVL